MPKQSQRKPQPSNSELTYEKTIATAELPFAAYIKAKHRLPLIDIQKSSNGRVTWSFELQGNEEAALVNEFYRGGQVSASEYFMELKNLKSTTYGV